MIRIEVVGDPHPFTPAQAKRMRRLVEDQLRQGRCPGRSASGRTLAMAVEYCEVNHIPYTIQAIPGSGYVLELR